MTAQITTAIASHPIFDNRSQWASIGIFKSPEGFNKEHYQRRINQICGLSPTGLPIVRLSWAWEAKRWENNKWDQFGNATGGEWRQKYRALTVDIGNGDYVDIAPPRWLLEERYEPQAIAQSWELTRYRRKIIEPVPVACRNCHSPGRLYSVAELVSIFARWDASQVQDGKVFVHWVDTDRSEGHMLACRFCNMDTELRTVSEDVWGEAPREGWYNLLPHIGIIADHANGCCKRAAEEFGEVCYGAYREPDGRELKRLKKAIANRNKEMATNPHIRPELDAVALEQAKRWGLQMMAEREVQKRGELAEMRRAHRFNNNIVYSV